MPSSSTLSYTHIHRLSCPSSIVLPVWRYGRCAAESPHRRTVHEYSQNLQKLENKSHRLRQDSRNRSSSTPWNTLKFCGSDTQDRNVKLSRPPHVFSRVKMNMITQLRFNLRSYATRCSNATAIDSIHVL